MLRAPVVLFLGIWIFGSMGISNAAVLYLDNNNGNDNNPGDNPGSAVKTPAGVKSRMTGSDTVYLRGTSIHTNRFDEGALGAFPGGSSWANATVFTSYPGETAEIKTQMPNGFYPIQHRFGSWIIWSNIVVNCTNGYAGVVVTDNAHHIRFQSVIVKDVPRSHCWLISPGSGGLNKSVEIINCQGLNWGYNKQGSDNDLHGAYISTSSNLIERTFFRGSSGGSWAIHNFTGGVNPLGNIFRYNRMTGPQTGGGIAIAGGDDTLAHDNVFYDLSAGRAIHLDQGSQRARILHNTIDNCLAGIFVGNSATTSDSVIENNIVTRIVASDGAVGVGTGAANTTVRNNLIYGNTVNYVNNGAGTTTTGNLIGGSFNAVFVNAAATNFAIQASSSARGAATTIAGMTSDHIGTSRPQEGAADIGAYEYAAGGQLPIVTVTATDNLATEQDLNTGTFTFTRSGAGTVGDLTVNYTVTGTATSGIDYVSLGTSIVIPDGQASATKTLTPLDDAAVEVDETVIVTVSTSGTYTIGTPGTDAATVRSNDLPPTPPPTPPGGGTTPGPGNDIPPYAWFQDLEKSLAVARKDLDTASRNIKDSRSEIVAMTADIRSIYREQTNTNAQLQKIKTKLGIQ